MCRPRSVSVGDVAGWKSRGHHPRHLTFDVGGVQRGCCSCLASVGGHRLQGLGIHCAGMEVATVSVLWGAIKVEEGGGGGARGRITSLSRFELMCWQFDVRV